MAGGMMLTTPPTASEPYSTLAGPLITSIRSASEVSMLGLCSSANCWVSVRCPLASTSTLLAEQAANDRLADPGTGGPGGDARDLVDRLAQVGGVIGLELGTTQHRHRLGGGEGRRCVGAGGHLHWREFDQRFVQCHVEGQVRVSEGDLARLRSEPDQGERHVVGAVRQVDQGVVPLGIRLHGARELHDRDADAREGVPMKVGHLSVEAASVGTGADGVEFDQAANATVATSSSVYMLDLQARLNRPRGR